MPTAVSLAFVLTGTALNIFGLVCGGRAFVIAHAAYGSGPLLPWVASASGSVRALWRRMTPWVKRGSVVDVSMAATLTSRVSARATVRTGFPSDLTDAERIERLVRAVDGIYAELDEDRLMANELHTAVTEKIDRLAVRLDDESQRLEALTREVASSDVRLQLRGLVSIALGTILLALPTVWELMAQL
jgi:hypothetical protein